MMYLSLDELHDWCNRLSTSHHESLWQRHLFADFLWLAYREVESYQTDFYVDAEMISQLTAPAILYYGWRDTGTHLWQYAADNPALSHTAIYRYLLTNGRQNAVKVVVAEVRPYVTLSYKAVVYRGVKIVD